MYDPLSEVIDHPIEVRPDTIQELEALRQSANFANLPGVDVAAERARLTNLLHSLLHRLTSGLSENPNKLWVLAQFKDVLEELEGEDTEAREHFGAYLEQVMGILLIDSSDGLLSFYLGGL